MGSEFKITEWYENCFVNPEERCLHENAYTQQVQIFGEEEDEEEYVETTQEEVVKHVPVPDQKPKVTEEEQTSDQVPQVQDQKPKVTEEEQTSDQVPQVQDQNPKVTEKEQSSDKKPKISGP